MSYRRKLRQAEAERYFIYVESAGRAIFPHMRTKFDVIVNKRLFTVQIDPQGRIWANYFWNKLPSFKQGDTVVMTKNSDGSFNVTVEKS